MVPTPLHNQRLQLLAQACLYGILDLSYISATEAPRLAVEMIAGGVQVLQLRAKNHSDGKIRDLAAALVPVIQSRGALFFVNDRPDIARDCGADGVHVGQDDVPLAQVRTVVTGDQLAGKSTHSLDQAVAAEAEGADYIGVGPVFATPTKPDYAPVGLPLIGQVNARVRVPRFCIGGIKLENIKLVLAAGAKRVVIVSGIIQAPDVGAYCRQVRQALAAQEKQ